MPISFDGWWLRTRGLAHAITTECGYCIGMGAMMDSMIFVPNLVHNLRPFCFAQTNSKRLRWGKSWQEKNPRLAPKFSKARLPGEYPYDVYALAMSIGRVFHSVYTLIFHTPTDLPLHAGTEDLLLLVDVYYLVWLAGGKP